MLKLNISKQLPLLNQSISTIHRLLKSGELNSVDLAKASLQRIKDTKVLNAFITTPEEFTLSQADASKQRFIAGLYREILFLMEMFIFYFGFRSSDWNFGRHSTFYKR